MAAELVSATLFAAGEPASQALSFESTVGDLAVPVRAIHAGTPVPDVDEMFRSQQSLSSVVVAGREGPELISRAAFEFRMAGRFGYGRALYSRRTVGQTLEPGTLVLDHDMALGAAAKAVLSRPGRGRYDDAVVRWPDERIGVLAVTPVFEHLALHFAYRALHDPLTGLPNRLLLAEKVRVLGPDPAPPALPRASAPAAGRTSALLYIDLDGFKAVNDGLGHEAGDAVLIQFAGRLRDLCRPGDVVARLAGDEFAVLLASAVLPRQAVAIADRVVLAAAAPFLVGDEVVQVGASVGVATLDGAGQEEQRRPVEVLLRQADAAMYRAKSHGRGRAEAFDHTRDDALVEIRQSSQTLTRELRRALDADQLELHYQPKVTLPAGAIIEFEALARWRHPRRGWISPTEFIPAAERSGLIYPLGLWALRAACTQAQRWAEQLRADSPSLSTPVVAVNVSPHQLADARFVKDVAAVLAQTDLPSTRLCLEVTESVATADIPAAVARLQALRDLGVQIALDDYGTGFSSLTLMRQLPLDWVKIDRSFIDSVDTDPAATVLVRLVVEAAHSLGLKVCAEGIERRAQADQLIAMGCEAAQGYLLGVPTPAALVEQRAIDYLHPDDRNRQVGAHFPTDSAARTVVHRVRHAAGHTV